MMGNLMNMFTGQNQGNTPNFGGLDMNNLANMMQQFMGGHNNNNNTQQGSDSSNQQNSS